MAVTDETEAKVRELREAAEERADRIRAGEKPWEDEEADVDTDAPQESPRDDDVGETESNAPDVVEVTDGDVDGAPAVDEDGE